MNQDHKDLLSAFHARGVKYVVVGGYAVIYHAQPRFTKDIDLFVKADLANAEAIYSALGLFGAPLHGVRAEDFAEFGSFFRFGRDPRGIDILTEIPGVDFDAVWDRRVEAIVDPISGLKAFFISKDDLVASKLATGRPQNIADVSAIREADKSRDRTG